MGCSPWGLKRAGHDWTAQYIHIHIILHIILNYTYYIVVVLVAQSCLTLCNPMDHSLPGPSVHGILQARMLEWVAISFSRRSSWPRDRTWVSYIAGKFLTIWATGKSLYIHIILNPGCCSLGQGSPTSPWPVWNQAAQQEVSSGWASEASSVFTASPHHLHYTWGH